MADKIICEDFQVTESIKNHIDGLSKKIREHQNENLNITYYVSKSGKKDFTVGIETRYSGKDFYSNATDADFYLAATKAKRCIRRQLSDIQKFKHEHRKPCPPLPSQPSLEDE